MIGAEIKTLESHLFAASNDVTIASIDAILQSNLVTMLNFVLKSQYINILLILSFKQYCFIHIIYTVYVILTL